MLCSIPSDVLTHRVAHFLDIASLLSLQSTNHFINQSINNPSAWVNTIFVPVSLRHLLYVTSSTSSSLPKLHIAGLDLSINQTDQLNYRCDDQTIYQTISSTHSFNRSNNQSILTDQHLELTLRCFPYIQAINLSNNQRLSIHSISLVALHCRLIDRLIYQSAPFKIDFSVVALFDHLIELDFSNCAIDDQSLSHLKYSSSLLRLTLANCISLRDTSFKFTSSKKAFKRSDSESSSQPETQSSDQSIKQSNRPTDKDPQVWPHLSHLNVSGCVRLTNRSIKQFALLPNLQSINLTSLPKISPGGLKYLIDRSNNPLLYQPIKEIAIQSCNQMNNQSLDFLSFFDSLTALDLRDTSISNQALSQSIHLFKGLKVLLLDDIDQSVDQSINQSALSSIFSFNELEILSLGAWHLTSKLLVDAADQSKSQTSNRAVDQSLNQPNNRLRVLNLHDSSIDCLSFVGAPKFRMLEELDLSGTRLNAQSMTHSINQSINQSSKQFDGPYLPALRKLLLAHCHYASYNQSISQSPLSSPAVNSLSLEPTSQSISFLAFFALHAPVLSQFDFTASTFVNRDFLSHLTRVFPRVFSLTLDNNQSINDDCLIVLSSLSRLSRLSLHGCTNITASGLKLFYQSVNQSNDQSIKQFFSSFLPSRRPSSVPQSPIDGLISERSFSSHFPSLSLPSFDFHLPQFPQLSMPTMSMPTMSIPTMSMPQISMPTMSMPKLESFQQLSMPHMSMPKLELPSMSMPRPFKSQSLSLESFGSFSGPFSSAFSSLHEEPPSPFAPPPPSPLPTDDIKRKQSAHVESIDYSNDKKSDMDISETETTIEQVDQSIYQPNNQSNNQSIDQNAVVNDGIIKTDVPDHPFPSLSFLHLCCLSSKEACKLASLVRRAHPFCVVEGEGETQGGDERDERVDDVVDDDDGQSESEDDESDNDDPGSVNSSVNSFHDPPSMSYSSNAMSRVYESLSFSLDEINDPSSVTSTTAEGWEEDEHHETSRNMDDA